MTEAVRALGGGRGAPVEGTDSERHPRCGYRRIAALLRQEGWPAGKRLVQRWRRLEGLRVPPTRRKQVRRGISTGLPTQATHRGHVWTWEFIADATVQGGALRMLSILDEHARECHVLRADRAPKSKDALEWLQKAIREHGAPQHLRGDNGPEFIGKRTPNPMVSVHRAGLVGVRDEIHCGWSGAWSATASESGRDPVAGSTVP